MFVSSYRLWYVNERGYVGHGSDICSHRQGGVAKRVQYSMYNTKPATKHSTLVDNALGQAASSLHTPITHLSAPALVQHR